ncbi:Protein sidekick-1 [Bagarius yarrelli]|uniref:unspecific monooxygenase n=1 Tax=Bagarius yarrelli TaxID=175774 RepID=A0A556TP54_BAGYA|nr:Protein sidekick-1 [Bagarius yarrelli]
MTIKQLISLGSGADFHDTAGQSTCGGLDSTDVFISFYFVDFRNWEAPADPVAPVIVIPPRNTTVVAGVNEVTLECVANARPVDKLNLVWRRNGVEVASGVGSFGRRLIIVNPTTADMGLYVCEASLQDSSVKPAEAKAFISIIVEPRRKMMGEVEKSVDIPCQARGVPMPKLEWYKDAVPLSRLNNPRYKVIPSMGLQIRRLQPGDAGIFQCFARNAAGETQVHTYLDVTSMAPSFSNPPADINVTDGAVASFTCQVSGAPKPAITWKKGRTYISQPPADRRVIKGTTAILECGAVHDARVHVRYVWMKGGEVVSQSRGGRISVQQGSLHISQTWSGDIGDYTCDVISLAGNDSKTARLEVIELPHSPRNLQASLNATDSRSVHLSWMRPFDGNSPLLHYIVELSENNSPWKVYLQNIDPTLTTAEVTSLTPARTYQFRVCAVNQVGKGQYSGETNRLMLREEPPSAPPKNIVASGRTNQSIMVQWQPPPEPQLNGVLRGYVLRYRLAGLPGEYQQQNITSPDINYCLITELIIWTQYEIQVAAYTGAGLSVFSQPVVEYTLQGVPTAPPQEVEVVAVNSTTIKFTWNPPPQQFINGINQGYKIMAWPEHSPESTIVVTITPDYHGTRHQGYIIGLKKFTWYLTSVLCFTTPGNGPRSSPKLVQTHEDIPGPVGRLSFTEILDTSLRVSWEEPVEKNGIITGYLLSWEAQGQQDSRSERTLSNSTLGYKVTGLTSLTTYTLEVAAMTGAGMGALSSSTISSGVPPELPGPPTNLQISKISPRSATLKFRAGDDGKTSISKWIVEGQVGSTGEEEDWKVLYEKENDPEAQVLEVPNLTPFTHYRFRMRQVNIVGSSEASEPSRVIQTLQAPPDVAPGSVSVRTASETSVWLRWVPLPETEYNGNPESVGYRVRVSRPDQQGDTITKVVTDRLEREITLEGLEEWTEYLFQIQAFNSIGPGPWSEAVKGRTRESVPSEAPENVTAEAMSSTRILVTWGPVPEAQQNGNILGYKVQYREKDTDTEPQVQVVKGNLTQSVLLRNLRKYVQYEIQVLAFTRIGDGQISSPAVLERTKDDVPGPPMRLVFPEVRLSEVTVVWQPPVDPNGIIMGYQVAYRLDSGDPNKFTTVEVGAGSMRFTASGLLPESAYIFRISAKTQQGWGTAAQAVVITTEIRERPQPPLHLSVPQDQVQSRQLRLDWVPGGDGSSPVRYFTLQLRQLPDGDWITHSSSISHNSTTYVVDRLKPYTSYKLRMMATNDIGDSKYSRETDAITTLQDVPDESPVIQSVKPSTTTSVLVQWQPPKEESVNGVLVGYRLYYRELQYDSTPQEAKRTSNSTTARADPTAKSMVKTVSNPSLTEFELTQLQKYQRYEIVITAYNIIGESPASSPVEVFVGEAAPSVAPQNIQVNTVSSTQLEVQWEPPPVETQNGIIQGYKIHYWETDNQNETEKVKILFLPETSVRLKNLTSYTYYMVKLSAFNAAGDGPLSEPRRGRTLQSAPSAPSFINFSEITSTTLNVSWGYPVSPNGVVEGYRVVYEPTAPINGISKVVTVDIRGSWQRWLKVRDLTKGVTYCFRVQARTISYGPEAEANITAGPVQGSPASPLKTVVTKSGSGLTIHWTPGDTGAGHVTGYVIEARTSDEGMWDTFVRHLPPSSTSHAVSLERLRHGVSYQFRVLAVNQYGYGEPSAPSAAMSAQVDTPFYEEWWFLIILVLCALILLLMIVFGLVLHGQNKKYKSCATGKAVSTVEERVTLDNGGFTALELNSRPVHVKSSFLRKNGTRSPPRPNPAGLRYSDEDICNTYNGAVSTDSTVLTERAAELTESEATDSECEEEPIKHSFVNHYMSDPSYFNSWKRQQKGLKETLACAYEECASGDGEGFYQTVVTQHSVGGVYTPAGQPAPELQRRSLTVSWTVQTVSKSCVCVVGLEMSFLESLSVTWSLVVLVVTLLFIYSVWPYGFFKNLGIPGPRPWPFVGTFLSYRKGFYHFDMECSKKYGKVWGIFDGRLPILMILDLEMIKAVMIKECFSTFTNRRDTNLDLAGPFADGITVVKDEKWKRIRASLSPFFTSGRLKEMFPIAEKYSNRFIDNLKKRNLQEAIKIKEVIAPYTMDVVTSASFSVEIDSINNPDDPFVTQLKKFLNFSFFSPLLLLVTIFPFVASVLGKLGLTLFSKSAIDFFYGALKKIKDQHDTNENRRVDFLQLMIQSQISDEQAEKSDNQPSKGLTDHEILSQSFIFILGGYDTTSTTLTYLLYNLAINPDCMSKLVEEIDTNFPLDVPVTYDALMKFEYLDMVINESMRLLPTAPRLERLCKKTIELNGIAIPKNTLVGIPTYVLQRDPQIWESPEEFKPERFSPENQISPYTFMPFGLGPRNCVGMRFALLIMKLVVVKLLQNFSVETGKETQIPIQLNALFQPKVPVTLKLIPRIHNGQ